jgi:hypothetical protein
MHSLRAGRLPQAWAVCIASAAGQFTTGHTLVIDGGLTVASGVMG